MRHSEIIKKMTLEQKANLCSGYDYWHMEGIEALGLPQIMLCDGPHGLRKKDPENKNVGLGNSYPATCFPTAATSACSWDPELLNKMGKAIADECKEQQVSVILGPGVNMKRSPLCGRNFEYFSEDPLLAGEMGVAFVKGAQDNGVGTSLKHFAVNSQETRRMVINEVVDERTLREIYLPAFEKTVKEAQPWTVMNAYNKLNGEFCSQNSWLQQKVLRDEWGFEGLIVTDWGASVDRVNGIKCGTDVEMPSSGKYNAKKIIGAVKSGKLDEKDLDKCMDNIIELILKSKKKLVDGFKYDRKANEDLAQKIATESVVLLKNEENILPLNQETKVAVIGEMAKVPRFQGAGSSLIMTTKLCNAYDALVDLGVNATYAQGYSKSSDVPDDSLIVEAISTTKNADTVLIFVGLTEDYESEGFDREHMELPYSQVKLIEKVANLHKNVVVVLAGGATFEMPWLSSVKGVVHGQLGGQMTGVAIADVLLGKVNPSGHLAETYPNKFEDTPTAENYPSTKKNSLHKEGVYIGYRYYETAKKDVLFPFGFGLSYTQFQYSDLKISASSIKDTDTVTVSFKVKNVGAVDGAEVAQLYVADKESTIFRPAKELKGFKKVFLKAGEEKEISIELGKRAFAYYNVNIHDWHVESGEFAIEVGSNVRDIALTGTINVESTVDAVVPDYKVTAPAYYTADVQKIPVAQFQAVLGKEVPSDETIPGEKLTILNTVGDASHTKWGKRVNKLICKITAIAIKKGAGGEDANSAMMQTMATQVPIRNFISMSMGVFSEKMAEGFLLILNDEAPIRGIFKLLGGLIPGLFKIGPLLKSI